PRSSTAINALRRVRAAARAPLRSCSFRDAQLQRASANPECGCKLTSRLNVPGSRRRRERLGGLWFVGVAHIHFSMESADCAADYPTSKQLLFCSSILGRRIEWDGYPDTCWSHLSPVSNASGRRYHRTGPLDR